MSLIDLKPVKRCDSCGHLIPTQRSTCPYCAGRSFSLKQAPTYRNANTHEHKPMSPEQRKKLYIGLGVLAAVIVAVVIFNVASSFFRLHKSIFNPLDEQVVASQIQKDATFKTLYDYCTIIRETAKTEEDKQKYGKITYKQMQRFINYYDNDMYLDEQREHFANAYQTEIVDKVKPRKDSLVQEWQKFMDENDASKYLDIEIKYGSWYPSNEWFVAHPSFWLNVKMPNGKVTACDVSFACQSSNGYVPSGADLSDIHYTLEELLSCNKDAQQYLTKIRMGVQFWDEYSLVPHIHSVTLSNGETLTEESMEKVPVEVRSYLDDPSEKNEIAMIQALIDKNYPAKDDYISQQVSKTLKEKDSLCYELVLKVAQATNKLSIPFTLKEEE